MQIMYVDESGDPGTSKFGSEHFILSGLIISDEYWRDSLSRLKEFRQHLKKTTGLLITTELHAAELVRIKKIEAYRKIRKPVRVGIINQFIQQIPIIFSSASVINICLHKKQFPKDTNFQELAWSRLIQRYDTYLKKQVKDRGIIVSDETDGAIIRKLLRKMRVYNPVPSHYTGSHNVPTDNIIEDIFTRSSQHSLFIQAVDFIAHSLYRKEFPKGSYRKYGLEKSFDNLEPILLKAASKGDPLGIVRK
ncbi:DUF3800 domain-containing protein [Larkinella bovis]|uniref:DUF3800 domain-containing protein n=1 Tax=Larkinella bovis TaxID=683041 RepID=A0ABW0IIJ8_9BACT